MTETSTPSDTEAIRAKHAAALRIIVDLHAAYGKGVTLDIDAARDNSTWLHLYRDGNALTAGFWDDGDVYTPGGDIVPGGQLAAVEEARVFFHRHGKGAR